MCAAPAHRADKMEVPTAIIMGGRARSPAFGRLTGSKVTKMSELTHFDEAGQAHMVNVGEKSETHRIAVACGRIHMQPATFELVAGGTAKKGDVIGIARVAAIMASSSCAWNRWRR